MDKELAKELRVDDEIVLRAWTEDDVESALEIVLRNREHLQTYMQWMTVDYSIQDARKFIYQGIAHRLEKKTLGLALVRGDQLIGSTGFNRLDWNALVCEIGYWIDKDEEGKGVITRACQAMIDYAFGELDMNRVEIRCSAENDRSAAVPERLGFKKEGHLRQAEMLNGRPHDFYIFGLLAHDPRLW
ncbi:MAG TPA: GNAT family protein [Pyrinomonadaceae bacterium]|nr:GNAT family protein [Pyrinomonadaceae bacterium]